MNTGLIAIAVALCILGEIAIGAYLLMHGHEGWAAFLIIGASCTPATRIIHGRDIAEVKP